MMMRALLTCLFLSPTPGVAACAEALASLRARIAEAGENLTRGYRIMSYAEAGFHPSPQRVPVGDGAGQPVSDWMVRYVYLDPDDPAKPLDLRRLHAEIDSATETARRDAMIRDLAGLQAECGGLTPD
ncbi:MAG: hypothetical protein Q4G26_04685 [Paracoccus sp. (in: a-proteobacteria)]|nr:hypothetical protein [Paracoccus sp. (in: a-proteobacteria)]